MRNSFVLLAATAVTTLILATACANPRPMTNKPLSLTAELDLPKFMGRLFVIANIPTFIEKDIYNATEDYQWLGNGKVATTFTYNKGALSGPLKTANPVGFVSPENNAVWKMQFIWPFKADYRVMYVDPNHEVTIIGREARDYVWLMARTPRIDSATYESLVSLIEDQGYDISQLRQIPHTP